MQHHPNLESLRPMERRVLKMRGEGTPVEEIAARFKKSPEFIERVVEWTQIPRGAQERTSGLSPLERRVLALRHQGEDTENIARRFKRTERFIRQVEGLAHYRKGLGLMRTAADQARVAEQART